MVCLPPVSVFDKDQFISVKNERNFYCMCREIRFVINELIEVVTDHEPDLHDKIQLHTSESLETGVMNWKNHNLSRLFLPLL